MTANELRIGNWILFHNGLIQVEPLMIFDIHNGTNKAPHFEPIPLTEEWLLKLGAKEVGIGTNLFEYDRFYLRWHHQFKYWYVTQLVSGEYITKVEFVHEWQNVVFALNGQELEVNI